MSPTIDTANSEMDASGASFVPMMDLTHDDDDTKSHMSDVPLQGPASAKFPSNISALVSLSQAGSDPVRNVHSLQTIPNQTGVNPWQLHHPVAFPQSVPAVLGPQEAGQMFT